MDAYHHYRVASVIGIRYGLQGFIPKYGHDIMELTPDKVSNFHVFGGTELGSSRGPQPADEIVDALERMNINVLFMIGGDGTMKAAANIVKEIKSRNSRISVIGIPKTIDNDINFVGKSFGFDTAVEKATEAIGCAHVEAVGAYNGIGIVKLMGRESGFIAAQATLALKEVNFVLVPESPFELEGPGGLLAQLEQRLRKRRHAVIVVAEGAGQHLCEASGRTDASGNPVLCDICTILIARIKEYFKSKDMEATVKFIDPSYIIRSVPANANDRVYSGFLGQNAVHAAMAGKTGMVVSRLQSRYVHVPLELVTSKRKMLNIESDYWRAVLESTGQEDLSALALETCSKAKG
jgi:6-phosphofructokinase 1